MASLVTYSVSTCRSYTHKIILRKLDKQRSEECDLTYFTTDYPELMIVQDSLENSVKLLEMSTHADSLDLDLELRLSEEFLHFQMERMIQSSIHEVQKHLCFLNISSIKARADLTVLSIFQKAVTFDHNLTY